MGLAELIRGWHDVRTMSASENLLQPVYHHHHRHKKFHVRPEAKGRGYQTFLGAPAASQWTASARMAAAAVAAEQEAHGRIASATAERETLVTAELEAGREAQRRVAVSGLWICAGLLLCVLIAATADGDRVVYVVGRLRGLLRPMINF